MAAGGGGGRDRYYCSVPLVKQDKMNEKVFTRPRLHQGVLLDNVDRHRETDRQHFDSLIVPSIIRSRLTTALGLNSIALRRYVRAVAAPALEGN